MEQYTQRLEKIEDVLRANLPEMFGKSDLQTLFLDLPEAVESKHLQPLAAPCRELLLLGGKRWRPLLLVLCAELFCAEGGRDGRLEAAYQAVPLVEFVHTASLIHDDIEDCADMRRGKPAAHIAFGLDAALNSGSWLYFAAFACIEKLPVADGVKLELYKTISAELRRLHLGQAMDIAWHRDNSAVPSMGEYEAMVRLKTGTLACLAAKTGALVAGAPRGKCDELGKTAADIGVGFQILDDVLNLTSGNPGKKRGDDIVEGKKSLPVLLHLESRPQDSAEIAECFARARREGIDSPAVEECIALLSASGAVEKARAHSRELIERSCGAISDSYGGSPSAQLISDLFLGMLRRAA